MLPQGFPERMLHLLGVGSPVGLHSAAFCPDSSVLLPAARFLAESAWSVLEDARA